VPSEKELVRVLDYLLGLGTGWKSFTDGPPVAIKQDGTLASVRYAPGWADLQAIVAEALQEHRMTLAKRKPDARTRKLLAELDAAMDAAGVAAARPRSRVTSESGRDYPRRLLGLLRGAEERLVG